MPVSRDRRFDRQSLIEALMPRQLLSAGVPDTTFGTNGYATVDMTTSFLLPAGSGKTVAIGYGPTGNRTQIERFTPAGGLDPSFDGDGKKLLAYGLGYSSLVQADGKLVIAVSDSTSQGYLARLNTDGSLDTTFGTGGYARSTFGVGAITALAQQSDGKILAVGNNQPLGTDSPVFSIQRFNANGTIDTAFGSAGKRTDLFSIGGYFTSTTNVTSGNTDVGVLPNGKILIMANPKGLIQDFGTIFYRLNADGSTDTGFNSSGGQWFNSTSGDDELYHMAVRSDGSVIAAGYENNNQNAIFQWLPMVYSQPYLDTTFDGDGVLVTGALRNNNVYTQGDGKIVGVSTQYDLTYTNTVLTVSRYNANGSADTSFGSGGKWTMTSAAQDSIYAAAVDPGDHSVTLLDVQYNSTTGNTLTRLLRLKGEAASPLTAVPGSYTVGENASIILNGSASNGGSGAISKYEWDYNYNGVTFDVDATGAKPTFSAVGIDGPTTRVIALRVTDSLGATAVQKTLVSVTNAPPSAVLSGSTVTLGANSTVTFTSISDVTADAVAGYTFAYDFNNDGDFTDPGDIASTTSGSASYKFAAAGTYLVHARVTDKDGGSSDVRANVIVNAPAGSPSTVTLQAEDAAMSGGTFKQTNHSGYTGTGFADYGGNGSAVQFTLNGAAAGAATLSFRYANGSTTARPLTIIVNGTTVGTISGAYTGSWDTWKPFTINANLLAGANTIKAVAGATGGGNLDSLTVTRGGTTPTPTPTPTPTATSVLVDAGGPAAGSFTADSGFSGGKTSVTTSAIDTSAVVSPAPQTVYQTERFGNFTYTIANLDPGQAYYVRLDFAETYWSAAGKRVFNVVGNGVSWLDHYDVYAAAGAKNKATFRMFRPTADSSGKITIVFTSIVDNAKVSGIRVSESGYA